MTNLPLISSIILNYNRAHLLEVTLNSYLKTTTVPFELYVIDNNSQDDSRSIIEKYAASHANIKSLYLAKNSGGAPVNQILPLIQSSFLHLSENDQQYLPGWCEHVLRAFETFSELAQLSLHGATPTPEEVWVKKRAEPIIKDGLTLYKALFNVGFTSVIKKPYY